MEEFELRTLIEDVKVGRLSRRRFVQVMVGLGLTAPMAAQMLTAAGVAQAQPKNPVFTPTKRGGGGPLAVIGRVEEDDAARVVDLRRGDPDPVGIDHRFDHIGDQRRDFGGRRVFDDRRRTS